MFGQLQMKRVAFLNYGLRATYDGGIVCGNINNDGRNELIFGIHNNPNVNFMQWQVWQCQPMNHYELVFVDTGWPMYGPPPLGIKTGNLFPFASDYLDIDSAVDLVGMNKKNSHPDSLPFPLTTVQEGSAPFSYPTSLVWFDRLGIWFNVVPHYIVDLDQDGRKEILFRWYNETYDQGTRIYKNTVNNQYELVFNQPPVSWGTYAFGDFDQDGRMDMAFPGGGNIYIRECTGNNQYPLVCSLPNPIVGGNPLSNPHDCWAGNDVDNDGKPEFFIAFCRPIPGWTCYLYMWEATGTNTYEETFIDQISTYQEVDRRSMCDDIDGDGIEEIIWSVGSRVLIYKATDNNQFQRIWDWNNDHGGTTPCAIVNVYDMNRNGYNEVIVGGGGKTSIFEVEAVRLLRPNGGEIFQSDSQQLIRWQTFNPPRCDSLSLIYSTDNGSNYTMIAHGISGNDTSYLWTVPNVNSDSCKIKIIAYGPGWQYDESDGTFSITSLGITEIASLPLAMTLDVRVYPNPVKTQTVIHYSLPAEGKVSLQLYNISGRLVKTLIDDYKKPGNYKINLNTKDLSAGVYFLSLETESKRIIERVIIVK